ncbi:peptidase family m20 m25 m40 protein [Diplocarpon rosae]|nr:peptidase family m20 m25 m40 protein [Diplocarpon rosae]
MVNLSTGDVASRATSRQSKVRKQDSKTGLRAIFTRNKIERDESPVRSVAEEVSPWSEVSETSMLAVAETTLQRSLTFTRPKSRAVESDASSTSPPRPTFFRMLNSKPPRTVFGATSAKEIITSGKFPPLDAWTTQPSMPPTMPSAVLHPPTFFQACQQAVKHAQLSASTLSVDVILRLSSYKGNSCPSDEHGQATPDREESGAALKKTERAMQKQRRQLSNSLSKAGWTQKIFVLVTSGYLLQYSRDGSFDRLPEKMMQLGSDSVAFASDVMPGKHWVLQIAQGVNSSYEIPAAEPWTLLSRLASKGSDSRRTTTSMLLVLDSAEDMDSWLAVIRREIEALGATHCSEIEDPKSGESTLRLGAHPSHRPFTQDDAERQSYPTASDVPTLGPPPTWVQAKKDSLEKDMEDGVYILIHPPPTRPSTGHLSITGSIMSNDGWLLDSLRDSTSRLSHMSSDQRTLTTSRDSSPAASPTREDASFDDTVTSISADDNHLKTNPTLHERRRSFHPLQVLNLEPQTPPTSWQDCTHGSPASSVTRSRSSSRTPNFSVPNSSRKRFSIARSPSPSRVSVNTSPRGSIRDNTRRAASASHRILHSPHPATDSPRIPTEPAVITPTDTTFSFVTTTAKPSIITIPPRFLLPSAATSSPLPRRVSSLVPINGPESSFIDIHFPRRCSSTQPLRETRDDQSSLDEPLHAGLVPPAALTTPLPPSPLEPFCPGSPSPSTDMGPHSCASLGATTPVKANTKLKLRRPHNIQINATPAPFTLTASRHPKNISPPAAAARPSSAQSVVRAATPAPHTGRLKPAVRRLREEEIKSLTSRRSLPALVEGPPPAPPPNCALPPLPPPSVRSKSALGRRISVKVAD